MVLRQSRQRGNVQSDGVLRAGNTRNSQRCAFYGARGDRDRTDLAINGARAVTVLRCTCNNLSADKPENMPTGRLLSWFSLNCSH